MLDDDDGDKDVGAISVTVIWPTIWFLSPLSTPPPHSCDAPQLKLSMQCIYTVYYIGRTTLQLQAVHITLSDSVTHYHRCIVLN